MDWGPLIYSSKLQRELSALICCLFESPQLFHRKNVSGGRLVPRIVSTGCPKRHGLQIIWGEGAL